MAGLITTGLKKQLIPSSRSLPPHVLHWFILLNRLLQLPFIDRRSEEAIDFTLWILVPSRTTLWSILLNRLPSLPFIDWNLLQVKHRSHKVKHRHVWKCLPFKDSNCFQLKHSTIPTECHNRFSYSPLLPHTEIVSVYFSPISSLEISSTILHLDDDFPNLSRSRQSTPTQPHHAGCLCTLLKAKSSSCF